MSCTTQQGLLWRSSLRRHAISMTQHVAVAVPRIEHDTSSCRRAGSTILHDAMPSREPPSVTQTLLRAHELHHTTRPVVAVIVEATCNLHDSARCRGCPTHQARHQLRQDGWQRHRIRCHALACRAQPRRPCRRWERISCLTQQIKPLCRSSLRRPATT